MTSAQDLFASGGGGSYPKLDELEGKLVLLKPSKHEMVQKPQRFGGKPGEMQDRITADCVVFEDDGTFEVFDDMYFSQAGIVNPCKKALKPGNKPFILGRVTMFPVSEDKKAGLDTTEKLKAAREAWMADMAKGKKTPEPRYAWGLGDFTDDDVAAAMKYVNQSSPLAGGDAAA